MAGSLSDRVAIVTGAGQGIGAGVSLALAKNGASVALLGRNLGPLEETAARIAEIGGRALPVQCDITDRQMVNRAVAKVEAELGGVWLLVNNAVSAETRPIEDVDDENLDQVVRTGIYGSLYLMQACFPTMKKKGGRILNFGSGGATAGLPEVGAYAIVKEGIRGLTKTAATGWGQYGITVNTICPMVSTPLFDRWWEQRTEEERAQHLNAIPMRRMGDAEQDVGSLIVFLAGEGGSYITSRTLHVDGGRWFYDR